MIIYRLMEMRITWWKWFSRLKLSLRSSSRMNVDQLSQSGLDRPSWLDFVEFYFLACIARTVCCEQATVLLQVL